MNGHEDATWASLGKANRQFPKNIILTLNRITEILQNHQKTHQAPKSAAHFLGNGEKEMGELCYIYANKRCPGQKLCTADWVYFPFSACYTWIFV